MPEIEVKVRLEDGRPHCRPHRVLTSMSLSVRLGTKRPLTNSRNREHQYGTNEMKGCVTVGNGGMYERSAVEICGKVCDVRKPFAKVAKAGRLGELGFSNDH